VILPPLVFPALTNKLVFVPGNTFQPSLIFVDKVTSVVSIRGAQRRRAEL